MTYEKFSLEAAEAKRLKDRKREEDEANRLALPHNNRVAEAVLRLAELQAIGDLENYPDLSYLELVKVHPSKFVYMGRMVRKFVYSSKGYHKAEDYDAHLTEPHELEDRFIEIVDTKTGLILPMGGSGVADPLFRNLFVTADNLQFENVRPTQRSAVYATRLNGHH